ncbi:heparin lyase I family protein [Bradyrhizobium iriomotense]|uniref:Uncharacterized protein n=1 Tax=Bradyrhizobium iriomotense TaxID=441950 RepID=A0ABQ6AWI5_9BRAD|nr:heparin lyase I family protein [Bradyrhizobium iriomotense]GLR86557.1 hypothetical protein GCM10007857_32680 [Bradyrhizobium iriomotense]
MDTTGTITSFSPIPKTRGVTIGGDIYGVHTAGKSYSLTNPDSQTLQFTIQPGDAGPYDSGSVDRAEICAANAGPGGAQDIPVGTPIGIDYQFMVQPNGPNNTFTNTASWFVTGEMHNDDSVSGVATSPPFAIQLAGNHLQVVARYCPPGGNPGNGAGSNMVNMVLWTDPNPIVPGRYYDINIQSKLSNTGAGGYLDVSIDGKQVVNYTGLLGYGAGTYWMDGLYRNAGPTETVTADFRNFTMVTGSTAVGWKGVGGTTTPTSPTTPVSGGGTTTPTSPTTPVSGGGTTTPTSPTRPVSGGGTTTPTSPTTPVSGGGTTTPTSPTKPVSGGGTTTPTSPTTPVSGGGTTTPSSTKPVLTIADHSLWVAGRGGTVDLGTKVKTTDSNDVVTLNITGLPKYETITDKLDGQTFRGNNITLTAAQVDSGLVLHSYYRGGAHPTATLTLTASAKDPTTGAVATASPQTITVVDPRPAATTTTTTTSPTTTVTDHSHPTGTSTATPVVQSGGTSTTSVSLPTSLSDRVSALRASVTSLAGQDLAGHGSALFSQIRDVITGGGVATSAPQQISVTDHPVANGTSTASLASQSFALLNQYLASNSGRVDAGQIVSAVSQATGLGQESLLARPH